MDDFLIHGTKESINGKVSFVLDRSREVGLKFNSDKIMLTVLKVSIVGHLLTPRGLKPHPMKVRPYLICHHQKIKMYFFENSYNELSRLFH